MDLQVFEEETRRVEIPKGMDHSKPRPTMPGSTPHPPPKGKTSVYQSTSLPRFEESYLNEMALREELAMSYGEDRMMQVQVPTQMMSPQSMAGMDTTNIPKDVLQTGNVSQAQYYATQQRKTQGKAIKKTLSRLPYQHRSEVEAFVNMALSSAEFSSKQLEQTQREVGQLRSELIKKRQEVSLSKKLADALKQKLHSYESNIDNLKEDVDAKVKFHIRNKHALTKLANTNRMLIGTLEALQVDEWRQNHPVSLERTNSAGDTQTSPRPGQLSPIQHTSGHPGAAGVVVSPTHQPHVLAHAHSSNEVVRVSSQGEDMGGGLGPIGETTRPTTGMTAKPGTAGGTQAQSESANAKLRESLLRVQRAQYIAVQKTSNMDNEILDLRQQLKESEQQKKKLKSELDELLSVKSTESSPGHLVAAPRLDKDIKKINTEDEDEDDNNGEVMTKKKKAKNFGKIDSRFKALLKREAIDATDGLLIIRRIIGFIAGAPADQRADDLCRYITGREVLRIFDVEMASVYVKQTTETYGRAPKLRRFNCRSTEPEEYSLDEYERSLAWDCVQAGHCYRMNSISRHPRFNKAVDGVGGVIHKRLLYMPLRSSKGDILGCVGFLNRTNSGDAFTEADELMLMVLCDQLGTLLSFCNTFRTTESSMRVYRQTVEAQIGMYELVRDSDSMAYNTPLTAAEVIHKIEDIARSALRCTHTKAFLVSDYIVDEEPGCLVMATSTRTQAIGETESTNFLSSIAGQSYRDRETIVVDSNDLTMTSKLNPAADLDVSTKPMVVVPVMNTKGVVVAVVEFIPGEFSPEMHPIEAFNEPRNMGARIMFPQAAQWLCFQLTDAVKHMLSRIGKQPFKPAWYPLAYSAMHVAPYDVSHILESESNSLAMPDDASSVGEDAVADAAARRQAALAAMAAQSGKRMEGGGGAGVPAHLAMEVKESRGKQLIALEEEMAVIREENLALKLSISDVNMHLENSQRELAMEKEGSAALINAKDGLEDEVDALTLKVDGLSRSLELAQKKVKAMEEAKKSDTEGAEGESVTPAGETNAPAATAASSGGGDSAAFSALQSQLDTLLAEKTSMQSQMDTLTQSHNEALTQVQTALTASNSQITTLTTTLEGVQSELSKKTEACDALTQQLVKMADDSLKGINMDSITAAMNEAKGAEQSVVVESNESAGDGAISNETSTAPAEDTAVVASDDTTTAAPVVVSEEKVEERGTEVDTAESPPDTTVLPSGTEGAEGGIVEASGDLNLMDLALASDSKPTTAGTDKGAEGLTGTTPALSAKPPPGSAKSSRPPSQGTDKGASPRAGTHEQGTELPYPWERLQDEHGNIYYHNTETSETSWEIPTLDSHQFTASTEGYVGLVINGYTQMFDADGSEYWVSHDSGESVWELPAEVVTQEWSELYSNRPAHSAVAAQAAEEYTAVAAE